MLNVFLAIAVDNLATAQELTAEQEEAEALAKEQKEKSLNKEVNMFIPTSINPPPPEAAAGAENNQANKNEKDAKDKGKGKK